MGLFTPISSQARPTRASSISTIEVISWAGTSRAAWNMGFISNDTAGGRRVDSSGGAKRVQQPGGGAAFCARRQAAAATRGRSASSDRRNHRQNAPDILNGDAAAIEGQLRSAHVRPG